MLNSNENLISLPPRLNKSNQKSSLDQVKNQTAVRASTPWNEKADCIYYFSTTLSMLYFFIHYYEWQNLEQWDSFPSYLPPFDV